MPRFLAAGSALLLAIAAPVATAQSTPEAAANAMGEAVSRSDWAAVARAMHPDALRQLRQLFSPFMSRPGMEGAGPQRTFVADCRRRSACHYGKDWRRVLEKVQEAVIKQRRCDVGSASVHLPEHGIGKRRTQEQKLAFGDCELDLRARKLFRKGREVRLTAKEYRLLEHFASRPGCAMSRDGILDAVWGRSVIVTPRSIDRCVATLRAKIERDRHRPAFIRTIRDIGYRFEPDGGAV